MVELKMRSRDGENSVEWDSRKTAIIISDMWDTHTCKSAAERVAEMAPAMNLTLKAARDMGMLIIHCPSDVVDFYGDIPARRNALEASHADAPVLFKWNYHNEEYEGPLAKIVEKGGCSCDTEEPCYEEGGPYPWTRQIETLEIMDQDGLSWDGQEVYNMLQADTIENIIVMGVHTNACVLGRPFGIRQMVYLKKNVVLCRDLTDSIHRSPGRHWEGLETIIRHIEEFWCPTITSDQLTGGQEFRFKGQPK